MKTAASQGIELWLVVFPTSHFYDGAWMVVAVAAVGCSTTFYGKVDGFIVEMDNSGFDWRLFHQESHDTVEIRALR